MSIELKKFINSYTDLAAVDLDQIAGKLKGGW